MRSNPSIEVDTPETLDLYRACQPCQPFKLFSLEGKFLRCFSGWGETTVVLYLLSLLFEVGTVIYSKAGALIYKAFSRGNLKSRVGTGDFTPKKRSRKVLIYCGFHPVPTWMGDRIRLIFLFPIDSLLKVGVKLG
jgi:hypothetical protein